MSIETYRYLFSALIQVFGAIIAIGGVFLVWKYDLVQRNIETLKKRLARLSTFIEQGITRDRESELFEITNQRTEDFLTYDFDRINHIIKSNYKDLNANIDNQKKIISSLSKDHKSLNIHNKKIADFEYSKKRIRYSFIQFQLNSRIKSTFRRSIWLIMGIPASLSILFSLGLIWGDECFSDGGKELVSYLAVLISLIGLGTIINISSKSFILKNDTKNEFL